MHQSASEGKSRVPDAVYGCAAAGNTGRAQVQQNWLCLLVCIEGLRVKDLITMFDWQNLDGATESVMLIYKRPTNVWGIEVS